MALLFPTTNPVPKVVATVPIKEINDQRLANAPIEIEGEESKDNEITIVVSSYDFEADKEINLSRARPTSPANTPWQRRRSARPDLRPRPRRMSRRMIRSDTG